MLLQRGRGRHFWGCGVALDSRLSWSWLRCFSVTCVHEAHVDQKNKVVTTPAFMCDTALHHIHDGIGAMVQRVLELAGR